MLKYFTFLPILFLTLSTISPITIAQQKHETTITRSTAPTPKYTGVVKQVDDIAQQITVRIEGKDGNGSGVIIGKEGNTYSVMTTAYVAKELKGYSIITPTQERIVVKADQITILNEDLDIALVKFTSSQNYRVAELANYQFKDSDVIFISGFPESDKNRHRHLSFGIRYVSDSTEFMVKNEYSISNRNDLNYNSFTLPGMSRAAILNREGRLVGIQTIIINTDLNNFSWYAQGISVPTILGTLSREQISTANLKIVTAIPSKIPVIDFISISENLSLAQKSRQTQFTTTKELLDYSNSLWRTQEYQRAITSLNRSTAPAPALPPAPPPKYTGIVKQVDDIAQQITVRIEDKEGNGSGVIIAKEGNTYSVITAAHVVENKEGYSIITPTKERIVVKADRVTIFNKDLDIALVKFTSSQNYRTAELANYSTARFAEYDLMLNNWVFVSGFPGQDTTHRRYLSIGTLISQEIRPFKVKDNSSFSKGNNLIYANRSLPGMSGGAVLDSAGRLLGINTSAENEQIITDGNYEEIEFGRALGISVSTIIEALSKAKILTDQIKVVKTFPSQLTEKDHETIVRSISSGLSKPSQTSTAKEWLDYGNLLSKSYKDSDAILAFDKAISILNRASTNPDKDQLKLAYFGKGVGSCTNINYEQAIGAFQAAIAIDPKFIQAWLFQGDCQEKLGRNTEALVSYQKLIELEPNDFTSYVRQGEIFLRLKRFSEAINSYSRAIKIQPKHSFAYTNRGIAYNSLGQYSEAITDLTQSIKLDPQGYRSYQHRGTAYISIGEYDKGRADVKKSGELFREQEKKPKQQENMEFLEKIISEVKFWRGIDLFFVIIQYGCWIIITIGVLQIVQVVISHYLMIRSDHSKRKQYQLALNDCNKAIEINPQDAEIYLQIGIIYANLGQYDKIKPSIVKAAKLFQQQGNHLQYQAAIELLEKIEPLLNSNTKFTMG